ncbi:tail repeat-like protein [Vibrio phage vB_VmeM-32]|nr:tail repeat-like protein [Vibrio phage vB_VmeM-32]
MSEQNFTLTEKVKLSNIEAEASKNQPDGFLIDRANHVGTQPISSVTNLQSTLDNKVDAVAGKVLSDQNYTLTEKVKLSNIEAEATKNQPDSFLLDRSNHVGAIAIGDVDNLQSSLDNKVNTTDSRLSDAREWIADEVSLEEAQARTSGTFKKWSALRVGQSIIAWWQSTGNQEIIDDLITSEDLNAALNGKVDKVAGFGLSEANFTQAEKDKLASLEDVKFKGLFETVEALETAYPTADPGSYAFIDGTAGNPNQLYVWSTDKWEIVGGEIVSLTPAQVKQLLLENADTHNFGDTEKQKLEDAVTQTELANALTGYAQLVHNHSISQITGLQSELDGKAASEHTHGMNQVIGLVTALNEKASADHDHTIDDVVGLQTALDGKAANIHTHQINQIDGLADSLDSKVDKEDGKGLSSNDYTTVEKNKLGSIESNATANATDAQLRDRTTHTGTQAISTVTGLQTVLNDKVDKEDGKGLSSNDYTNIDKDKLDGIANNATANATDAQLRDRSTHTGTQAISTVTGLQTALDSKVDKVSGKGLSTNDYDNVAKGKVDSLGTAAFTATTAYEPAGSVNNAIGNINQLIDLINGEVI